LVNFCGSGEAPVSAKKNGAGQKARLNLMQWRQECRHFLCGSVDGNGLPDLGQGNVLTSGRSHLGQAQQIGGFLKRHRRPLTGFATLMPQIGEVSDSFTLIPNNFAERAMQMNHIAFAQSPALRASLKRGLARQAVAMAARTTPDLPGLFAIAARMRPNRKAMTRLGLRLTARPGVIRVAVAPDATALTFTTRAVREVEARVEGNAAFRETGVIYLRARVSMTGHAVGFGLSAISFGPHALERLIERSDIPLHAPILTHLDAEAQAIFRGWDRDALIHDASDEYYPAATPGLWAGGHDLMALDPDWRLVNGCGQLPIFSARTYLTEAQMRPTLWLRWKNDPACRMA
jgi:hypothetical protein